MLTRVAAYIWVLGAVSVVAGCGKSEDGADPIPKAELPTRAASALCDSMSSCCSKSGYAFDSAGCKQYQSAEIAQNLAEYDPAKVAYDAQAAGDCLEAIASHSACGDFDEDDAPACERVFLGKLAPGALCSNSQECRREPGQYVYCTSSDGLAPEVCTVESPSPGTTLGRGQAGDSCIISCNDDNCFGPGAPTEPAPGPGAAPIPAPDPVACYRTDGLFCDAGMCAPLIAVGQPCTSYEACRGEAFCNFNTQVCTAPLPNGEACEGDSQCQSGACNDAPPSSDPLAPFQVCAPAGTVSAADCAEDFSTPPDSTDPGSSSDPGSMSGDPAVPPSGPMPTPTPAP